MACGLLRPWRRRPCCDNPCCKPAATALAVGPPAACDDLAAYCLLPGWLDCCLAWRAGFCEPGCDDDLAVTTLAVGPAGCPRRPRCLPACFLALRGWLAAASQIWNSKKSVAPLRRNAIFFDDPSRFENYRVFFKVRSSRGDTTSGIPKKMSPLCDEMHLFFGCWICYWL